MITVGDEVGNVAILPTKSNHMDRPNQKQTFALFDTTWIIVHFFSNQKRISPVLISAMVLFKVGTTISSYQASIRSQDYLVGLQKMNQQMS